jgi:hypothetical protein
MWDRDDHFGRWVQLVCAVPLLLIGGMILYFSLEDPMHYSYQYRQDAAGLACFVLGGRCLWYAVTGKNNVNNRDL